MGSIVEGEPDRLASPGSLLRFLRDRRRQHEQAPSLRSGIPSDVTPSEAVAQVVEEFAGGSPRESDHEVESIEAIDLLSGQWPHERSVCIELRWRQWESRYGLLMPIERLVEQAGGLDAVAFYLHLAVDEPHGESTDTSRVWFIDLPSGLY